MEKMIGQCVICASESFASCCSVCRGMSREEIFSHLLTKLEACSDSGTGSDRFVRLVQGIQEVGCSGRSQSVSIRWRRLRG
jgi:hypothetical protein